MKLRFALLKRRFLQLWRSHWPRQSWQRILARPQRASWRVSLVLTAALLLIPLVYLLITHTQGADAAWWDTGYGFRQRVPVSNSSGSTQTNFQVQLTIDTATLITAGKLQSDCDDLRFTARDGKVLSYWLEPNTCNTATTKVFVKVPSIPTSGADVFYYYGNPGASSASSPDQTFIKDMEGPAVAWPLDDTTTTQSYSRVVNPVMSEGRDLVINGGFDSDTIWNKSSGAGWTIANGVTHSDGTGSNTYIYQTLPIIGGKRYQVTYTISNYVSGSVRTGVGTAIAGTVRSANGTYTENLTANANGHVYFQAMGPTFVGDIDNVTVKQLDIPGSSNSPTQLLVDGDMETSGVTNWTVVNSAALTKGTGSPHGGSQVLRVARNGVNSPQARQTILTIGQTYRIHGYTRSDGSALPQVVGGGVTGFTGTASTSWQPFDFVFVATTTTISLNNTTSTGTQYVEFDDVVVSPDNYVRTGELLQDVGMELNDVNSWTKNNASDVHSKETTSPHGGSRNLRVTRQSGGVNPSAYMGGLVVGKTYRATGWFRGDGTAIPNFGTNGNAGHATGTSSTSWQYFDTTFVNTGTAIRLLVSGVTADGQYAEWDDVSVVEVSPLVGRPTNGVTLGASSGTGGHLSNAYSFDGTNDNVNIYSSDVNSVFNPDEITVVAWAKVSGAGVWSDGTTKLIALLRADINNTYAIYKSGTNTVNFQIISGGVNKDIAVGSISNTGWMQLILTVSKANNEAKAYINGVQVGSTQTGLGTWVGNLTSTTSLIGALSSAGSNPWSGLINDVRLYDRALTAEEIAAQYSANSDIQAYSTPNYQDRELLRKYNAGVTVGTFAAEEVGAAPVAFWKLDDGQGQITQDSSTNNNDGTLGATTGASTDDPTWITEDQCVSGKCLKFDGSNDSVKSAPIPNASTNFSVSMWVKPVVSNTWQTLYQSGTATNYWRVNIDGNGKLDFTKNAVSDHASTTSLITNQWNHIEIVKSGNSGSNVTFYVNGQPAGTASVGSVVTPSGTAYLGAPSAPLNGFMDEPKIYTYARTAAQVKEDFNQGAAKLGAQSQIYLSNGLVGYWKMDEASWNGTSAEVNDSSGNGNNGTTFGTVKPSAGIGKFGNGGVFSTSSNVQYMSMPNTETLTTGNVDYTVSTWVKFDSGLSGTEHPIISKVFASDSTAEYELYYDATANRFNFLWVTSSTPSSVRVTANTFGALSANTWYLVTAYHDSKSNTIGISVNGGRPDVATAVGGNAGGASLNIGRRAGLGFNGTVDEVRIYKRVLSPAEVQDLYNFAPGPIGYWKFDERTGSTAADSSGNGINGTLMSGASWDTGKQGNAVKLNYDSDLDQYVAISSTISHNGGFTKTAWINPSSISGCDATRCSILGPYFEIAGTTLQYYDDSLSNKGWHSGGVISLNAWQHVAITYDGVSSIKLYLNGVQIYGNSVTNTGAHQTNIIGAYSPTVRNFRGLIDEVKVYNYARTPQQILEDMGSNPAPSVAGNILPDPVAHYKFDEQNGQTVNSSIGSGYGGTLGANSSASSDDPAWRTNTACKTNGCLSFDGTNRYVRVAPTTALSTSPTSISAWVYPTSNSAESYIFDSGSTSNQFSLIWYPANVSYKGFAAHFGSGSTWVVSPSMASINTWHHVVASADGTTIRLFVDGKLVGSAVQDAATSPTTWEIGSHGAGGGFSGLIDEVKVYNVGLTEDQVRLDMNAGGPINVGVTAAPESAQISDGAGAAPVAEWKFDERTGTTANDTSGSGNTGTLTNGPAWTSGKIGGALSFDGLGGPGETNDYVNVTSGALFNTQQSFTVNAWVNGKTFTGQRIIAATNGYFVGLWANSGSICLVHWNGSLQDVQACDSSPSANTWIHYSGVYSGNSSSGTVYLYKNGVLVQSRAITSPTSRSAFQIGGFNSGSTNYIFDGKIDDVKVYNYARTPAQIAYDYNRGAPIGWWKMDECQGETLNDSSGNGYTGVLTIGPGGTQTSAGTCSTSSTAWANGANGKFNSSVNFDGSDDFATINSGFANFQETTPFSISSWVKTSDSTGSIVSKWDVPNSPGWRQDINSGNIRLILTNSTGNTGRAVRTNDTYNDNNWHHIITTYDGSSTANGIKIYVDGKLVPSSIVLDGSPGTLSDVAIRIANQVGVSNFQSGQIDDVRIYNYSLSADQVKKVMNEGASIRFGPATGSP